jgi:toxic protein SymE
MNNESPEIRSEIGWVLNYPSRSGHHLLASCQERKIKVNKTQYMRKLKDDPVGAGRQVPWIQLKGYWLKQAGFEIIAPVKVRLMNGCLVLTTTDEEPDGS